MIDLEDVGRRARAAARVLAVCERSRVCDALAAVVEGLRSRQDAVLAANIRDMERGRALGLSPAMLDRLLVTPERLRALASVVEAVAGLPDPVGEVIERRERPSGIVATRRRVPFGVVAVIYEARPTVTVDAAAIALKAGSATILRGGAETRASNEALALLLRSALEGAGLPGDAVQLIADPDRALVRQLLRMDEYVDLLIPRGGTAINRYCREHATMPVITGGSGVCHLYVDESADLEAAIPIVHDSKTGQPTACNALETLLVHRGIAGRLLPPLARALASGGVELRADEAALSVLRAAGVEGHGVVAATERDFGTEFMALVLAVRVVDDLPSALDHIRRYGTQHTDAILSRDEGRVAAFVASVDSAAVIVNASTRYHDAGELGLVGEIAISNQKLHARGPMSPRELTSYKWVVEGSDHVRG